MTFDCNKSKNMRYPIVAGLLNQMKKGILIRSTLNKLDMISPEKRYILSNTGSTGAKRNSITIKTVLR